MPLVQRRYASVVFFLCGLLLGSGLTLGTSSRAQVSTTTLQTQIDDSAAQIEQLKRQISEIQSQLDSTIKQKQTLQGAVKALDLNIQKLTKSITLTNTQITQKDAEIRRLSGSIGETSGEIGDTREQVGDSLRQLATLDSEPFALTMLGGKTLSDFFDEALTLQSLRSGLQNKIENLSALKSTLQTTKGVAEQKRAELASLKQNLAQQKQGLAISRQSQNDLLEQTKNKESAYQLLIEQKKAQQAKFEQDLLNYEAQLKLGYDPGLLPPTGSGALRWPVDAVRITQYYGNTPFATQNSSLYGGKGHNAIDLAASPGTPIRAARSGVVLGTGNTDATCPNSSYGKWIFIKHDNGLSTLYAHLSSINVSKGQSVSTGGVIGYSGSTGYATGPHLHFGVYATAGSEIASFPSKSCKGRIYTMPVADLKAYLNPLSYLPRI